MSSGKIDFICVGAEKCGTTWLAEMLRQHPRVFVPPQKELHYFNRKFDEDPSLDNYNFDKPVKWYLSFFEPAKPGQIKGEICPSYLWDEHAPYRIYEFNPGLKIFMILRDPVERTLSAYRFYIQKGLIRREEIRRSLSKHADLILARSAYFAQVKRYFDLFPPEQIRVYFFEDLRKDAPAFLRRVESFLGVEEFVPENVDEAVYVTGEPISESLNRFVARTRHLARRYLPLFVIDWARWVGLAEQMEKLRQANPARKRPTSKQSVDEETRQWLQEYFRADIEQLEGLLGIDLSIWKN